MVYYIERLDSAHLYNYKYYALNELKFENNFTSSPPPSLTLDPRLCDYYNIIASSMKTSPLPPS